MRASLRHQVPHHAQPFEVVDVLGQGGDRCHRHPWVRGDETVGEAVLALGLAHPVGVQLEQGGGQGLGGVLGGVVGPQPLGAGGRLVGAELGQPDRCDPVEHQPASGIASDSRRSTK